MDQLFNLTQKRNEVQNKKQIIEQQIATALNGDIYVSLENDSTFPKIYICDAGLLTNEETKDNMKIIQKIINHFYNNSNSNDNIINFGIELPKNLTLEIILNRILTDNVININGSPKNKIKEDILDDKTGDLVFSGNYEYTLKFHNNKLQQIIDKTLKLTINI